MKRRENRSLSFKEVHEYQVTENKELTEVFGLKKDGSSEQQNSEFKDNTTG
jgi:hypothetical protein